MVQLETVTVQLEPNSQAVLSFGKGAETVTVDRDVLFRSSVLSSILRETDGDTSTLYVPSGFVRAWLTYLNSAEPDHGASDSKHQGNELLLLLLKAADFFADEKTITKVCTEMCSRVFSQTPSRKRRRESTDIEDWNDMHVHKEPADLADPEQLSRLQLNDLGVEVLTQIPPHLAVEVIKALEGGIGPLLSALPPSLHHLAMNAHLPSIASEKALRLDGHSFVWSPSSTVLEALLAAVATTPLQSITVCCCCLEMLSVSTGVVDTFTRVLHSSPGLTSLALGGAFCTGKIVSAVSDALPALPELVSLTLQPDSLGIKRSQQLLTSLAVHGSHLTELSLHALSASADHNINPSTPLDTATTSTSTAITGNSCEACCSHAPPTQRHTTALAATLLRLTQLKSLNLTGDTLTGPSLRDIEAVLTETSVHSGGTARKFLSELTHLNFRCAGLSNAGSRALAPVLRRLTNLQELLFLWNPMEACTAKSLASAIGGLPRLTTVNLRHSQLGDVGAQAIEKSWSTLTSLRHVDLSCCRLTPAATANLMPVLKHFNELQHLDISGCPLVGSGGVDLSGAKALADALQHHTSLQHLFLRHVGLTSEAAKILAPCIARQAGLQSIYLQCNHHLGSTGIVELSRRFESLTCLKTLRLDCTEVDTTAAKAFGAALQRMTALKILNLIGFRLQSSDALAQVAFGAFFSKLECLEVLDLSGSNFSGPAAQGLSRSLLHMKNLQELHLQYNPMGDIGAISLGPVLAQLKRLREVNLIGVHLSDAGVNQIVNELDGHDSLELCLLDANDIAEIPRKRRWLSSQTDAVSKEVCLQEYWRRATSPL